jgi:hypothetical protein
MINRWSFQTRLFSLSEHLFPQWAGSEGCFFRSCLVNLGLKPRRATLKFISVVLTEKIWGPLKSFLFGQVSCLDRILALR